MVMDPLQEWEGVTSYEQDSKSCLAQGRKNQKHLKVIYKLDAIQVWPEG